MNFESAIKNLESKADYLQREVQQLKQRHESALEFTQRLLDECAKAGIKTVGISRAPNKRNWPFGESGNLFGVGDVRDKHGWPAVWGVAQAMKIDQGCGNTDQYQIDDSNLINGIYELKDGVWKRTP